MRTTPRTLLATRYITPLREGGSLPAIVEADDQRAYVVKFRGAGQGPKALIAELVAGEIGRALDLPIPEIVFVEVDPAIARNEPDQEIQDLLRASAGLNLALAYLPGALPYDPRATPLVEGAFDAALASRIVWFDAYVTNVDRTPRNPNLLLWRRALWLIDHGASLYFQHTWSDYLARSRTPFAPIRDHALLPYASELAEANAGARRLLTPERLERIAALIPNEWLAKDDAPPELAAPDVRRAAYLAYLVSRLEASALFVEEAIRARNARGDA